MEKHDTTTTTIASSSVPPSTQDDTPHNLTSPPPLHTIYEPAPLLATSRYNRQLLVPQISLRGQHLISQAKVLIIGLGGLGSPASLYLAGAGVHTLGLLDHDVVEVSNLHRQIVHRESSVVLHGSKDDDGGGGGDGGNDYDYGNGNGNSKPMTKVASAIRGCRDLNSQSDVRYVGHEVRLHSLNALNIIKDYDVVLDCTDNPATRYLISDCCVVLGKTLVSGAAQRLEGQMVVLNEPIYGHEEDEGDHVEGEQNGLRQVKRRRVVVVSRGPCYRCIFPHPPSPDLVKSCSEIGILGPVVGMIGTMMASETLRLIVQRQDVDDNGFVNHRDKPQELERKPTLLLYNAWPSDARNMFRVIGLRGKRKNCVVCGEDDVLKLKGLARITKESMLASGAEGGMDYESWCGRVEDVKLLPENRRISADEFLATVQNRHDGNDKSDIVGLVVDVREELEVELGPKIHGSINIPISKILRGGKTQSQATSVFDPITAQHGADDAQPVYFVCQRGNDSQIAAKKLMDYLSNQQESEGKEVNPDASNKWIGDVKGGFVAMDKIPKAR